MADSKIDKMLTIERLLEDELFIQCPLITSDNFISFCKERTISVNRDDLELYEKLGIFYPIARIEFPKLKRKIEYVDNGAKIRDLGILDDGEEWMGDIEEIYGHFWWEKKLAKDFYREGLLWSPKKRPFSPWNDFYDEDRHRKIESYYSIFQICPLYVIKELSTIELSKIWWSTYSKETIDKILSQVSDISVQTVEDLKKGDNIPDEIANVCQIISNRYFPKTQTDRRTINVSYPSQYHKWSWRDYCRQWDARLELSKMGITEDRIKKYQEMMTLRARNCDPLENWHDLIQFVSLERKKRLKEDALLAQTFYSMEMMLRLFYKELTGQELSEDFGSETNWKERVYGKGVPDSNMIFLEYLTNQFHLNPRPKLILIVEGRSEYEQIPRLAKEIGYSFDTLGIRVELLEGVGNFTSGKIERFIDHYHNLQTIVYLILDNENNAINFKNKILKKKSRYPGVNRHITNDNYIFIWDTCFEFDNFLDGEIAYALSSILHFSFTEQEIAACRKSFGKQRDPLSTLFERKTGLHFNKPVLAERLVDSLLINLDKEFIDGKPKRKLIIKIMEIIDLATRNYQPHSFELWKLNQESGYFGKKVE